MENKDRTVIVYNAPISKQYWNIGDKAIIKNNLIKLNKFWFPFDERYSVINYISCEHCIYKLPNHNIVCCSCFNFDSFEFIN